MADSMTNLKLKLSDLNKLSQDHTDSPRITRKPSDRKLQLISIDEHGEVTIDYSCGIRIEELLFDERRSVQFIKDFETTKPEAIKFLSQPQQLKEIVDCVLEDVERYLTPPKPQAPVPVQQQRPALRYTRSRDRMVLRKESSFDNLLANSPTRVSITSRETLQSLTLANTTSRPLSLSSDSITTDKKKKKRHNSNEELSSEERKRKRKEFNPDGSPKEKEKKRDKRRSSGEPKEKRKKDKDKSSKPIEPTIIEEPKTASDVSSPQESSEDDGGDSPSRKNVNDKLVPIPEGNSDTEKLSTSGEHAAPTQTQSTSAILEPNVTQAINNVREGLPRLVHSYSSPALLLHESASHRPTTPRLPDEVEEMPGTNKDKDANGEEECPPIKKTPVVDVSLFKDEGYRRQSLINFGSWVLTTPTLVIEALLDNEECLEILLGGLYSVAPNMFDDNPTKGREWFKVMHFLFCKYEKGPKLVEYLENPDHASKTKNIAFGLVNKIANGNVFRIFWEMMVGETLVNWSVKLEEDPFKLGESILEKFQAICNSEYTYKADLELMNITELVTQVIKRNPQSSMSTKFQSAQFIKPLIELSFADLPGPVIAHIISIITVILELSVNNDSKYNSRRFPPAILTFLESPMKPLLKVKQLIALDSALRHKPSTRQRRADPAQTAEQEQVLLNQFWGHSLIDSPFVSIKSLSIKSLELLNALLLSNFEAIHKQMDADEIFDLAFNAFFEQPLNSVLHHNVINMISNLFYCDNYDITIGFVKRSNLLDRICSELQPDENSKDRYIKASYTHYLIHLADKLHRVASMITPLNDVLEAHPRWKEVFETRIAPYLEEMSKKICK